MAVNCVKEKNEMQAAGMPPDRADGNLQVVPTRTVKTAKPKAAPARGSTSGTSAAEQADTQAVFDPDALLPRTDISPLLGSKVIASLGSANWKERNSTMEDIENIIRSAVRIQPTVGELVSALKVRAEALRQ